MAGIFQQGETVICSITVKNTAGTLQNAATSMNIKINKNDGNKQSILSSTAMTNDSTGTYHYDWASGTNDLGAYLITYTATDGTRVTIHTDTFTLE